HAQAEPENQANGFYVPKDIKSKRHRRTKAAISSVRDQIKDILEQNNPQTVRQVFYALTVRGAIAKQEVARRNSPETPIHRAVVDHLHLRAKPDVLWLHCPNGERRDPITGARLKRIWHRGTSFALELKGPGGRLSEAQLEFLARFNDAGGHSACAEGIDRAIAVLES